MHLSIAVDDICGIVFKNSKKTLKIKFSFLYCSGHANQSSSHSLVHRNLHDASKDRV